MVVIRIDGHIDFHCQVNDTVRDVVDLIHSDYLLIGGCIVKDGFAMFPNDLITEEGDYEFVNACPQHPPTLPTTIQEESNRVETTNIKSFTPTGVSTQDINHLFQQTKILTVIPEQKSAPSNAADIFAQYDYLPASNEAARIQDATIHLTHELGKFIQGFETLFKLVDVHNRTNFFDIRIGNSRPIRGTTDIAMVPKDYENSSAVVNASLIWFEVKLDADDEFDINQYINQVKLKILAASAISKFPTRVIVTNLRSKAYGYRLKELANNHGYALVESIYDSLTAMALHITDFLGNEDGKVHIIDATDPDMVILQKFKKQKIFRYKRDFEDFEKFQDLVQDSDLHPRFKYQAASEFLRSFGYESSLFTFLQNLYDPPS